MKKLATIVAVALIGTPALAADLGRPVYNTPPPAPAPVWSWTGFYIGANAGGSIGRDPTSLSETSGGFTFVASQTMSPAGFIGGGQLGYNYQYAPNWVIGIEGDFQGASQRDSLVLTCAATQPQLTS